MVPYLTACNLPDLHRYRYHQEILATRCRNCTLVVTSKMYDQWKEKEKVDDELHRCIKIITQVLELYPSPFTWHQLSQAIYCGTCFQEPKMSSTKRIFNKLSKTDNSKASKFSMHRNRSFTHMNLGGGFRI